MPANKLRIIHIVKRYKGDYPLRNAMVLGLDHDRFEAKVCYLEGDPNGANILDRHDASLYLRLDNGRNGLLGATGAIRRMIDSERPDILHCHRHRPTIYGVLASMTSSGRPPVIAHVHGLNRTRTLVRRWTNAYVLGKAKAVIAIAESVRQDVLSTNPLLDPSKVSVIYNGINEKSIAELAVSRHEARCRLGLEDDVFVFATVGRLTETKGQSHLIDAFASSGAALPNARLVIIGDGHLMGALKARAARLDIGSRVIFAGYRDDVCELLRGVDVFVFPSVTEGFGLALLEAMASGLPVIGSQTGGIPEAIGECGMLVPPADAASLAAAMVRMVKIGTDARLALGAAARKRVEERFSAEVMCRQLEALYLKVAQ